MVLVARTRPALDTLATQIEGAGGEAAVECCDMASTDQVIMPRVGNEGLFAALVAPVFR